MKAHSLKSLLIVPTTLLFTGFVVVLSGVAYGVYSSGVTEQSYSQMEATSDQVLTNYETYFSSAVTVAEGAMERYSNLDASQTGELPLYFDTLKELKPEIVSVSLFSSIDGSLIAADSDFAGYSGNPANEAWFLEAIDDPYINIFNQRESTAEVPYSFTLSRFLQNDLSNQMNAVLRLDFDFTQIVETISPVHLGEGGRFFIYDRDYQAIYVSEDSSYDEAMDLVSQTVIGSSTVHLDGHSFYLYCMTITNTTWRAAIFINIDQLEGTILTFTWTLCGSAAALLAVFIVFIVLLANRITGPIHLLQREMSRVESLDYEAYLALGGGGSREVVELNESFENMMKRIRQLTEDVLKEKEEQRRSELRALQNQINPHFLYNTLDSIIALIDKGEGMKAEKMIVALSRFFRLSISRGHNVITLEDEIEHARNYLLIQKMRFGDTFTFEIEKEEGLEGLYVVKLILQPIVENSIAHGLREDGGALIKVRVYQEGDYLCLEVKDNGFGMTKEKVNELLDSMRGEERFKGVGIRNVYARLKVYYGEESDIRIVSEEDVGTTVTIVIPIEGARQNEER